MKSNKGPGYARVYESQRLATKAVHGAKADKTKEIECHASER